MILIVRILLTVVFGMTFLGLFSFLIGTCIKNDTTMWFGIYCLVAIFPILAISLFIYLMVQIWA